MKELFFALMFVAGGAYAVTQNPASNATADSANTALTIVLRDANGATSVGALSATSVATTGTTGISASTSTTSSARMCIAGSFQTLPTSGWAEGCFAYQLSDHTAYVSTKTITTSDSWKALF